MDWVRFLVHFVVGAVVGALVGFSAWCGLLGGTDGGWLAVPAGAGIVGLIAAIWGDEFWDWFREHGLDLFVWW